MRSGWMSRHTPIGLLVATLTLFAAPWPLAAAERVAEFRGDRSGETAEFEVESPFLVDWIVNSDYPQSMGVTIALIDARTGTHAGNIVKTKYRGDGLRLIEESGRFRFKVDSSLATWIIKVDQLTRQEAEQYTPKQALDF